MANIPHDHGGDGQSRPGGGCRHGAERDRGHRDPTLDGRHRHPRDPQGAAHRHDQWEGHGQQPQGGGPELSAPQAPPPPWPARGRARRSGEPAPREVHPRRLPPCAPARRPATGNRGERPAPGAAGARDPSPARVSRPRRLRGLHRGSARTLDGDRVSTPEALVEGLVRITPDLPIHSRRTASRTSPSAGTRPGTRRSTSTRCAP